MFNEILVELGVSGSSAAMDLKLIFFKSLEDVCLSERVAQENAQVVERVHHCLHLPRDSFVRGRSLLASILELRAAWQRLGLGSAIRRDSLVVFLKSSLAFFDLRGSGSFLSMLRRSLAWLCSSRIWSGSWLWLVLPRWLLQTSLEVLHTFCLLNCVIHELFHKFCGSFVDLIDEIFTARLDIIERWLDKRVALVAPNKSLVWSSL